MRTNWDKRPRNYIRDPCPNFTASCCFFFEMRLLRLFPLLSAAVVALPAVAAVTQAPVADQAGLEFFEKHIRPVLAEKCYKCHSAESEKVKGGLLLDTREGIRDGGDSGHAVMPGNLEESLLVKALHWDDKEM